MAPATVVSPDNISPDEFDQRLGEYAPLIKAISDAKGGKSGLEPVTCLTTPHLETISLTPCQYSKGRPTNPPGAGQLSLR